MDSSEIENGHPAKAVIFANGPVPQKDFVELFINENDLVICADGGANRIVGYDIVPNVIIGDFDSVTVETLRIFQGVKIKRDPDQDTSDLYKSFVYAESRNVHEVIVFGAIGGRPDHFLINISLLKTFHDRLDIQYIDDQCAIVLISEKCTISGKTGQTISVWPFTETVAGLSTKGLTPQLADYTFHRGMRTLSLKAVEQDVTISLSNGMVIAVFNHSI
ncbi:thiamine diphosphokinase [candidate division KSB1 bacterium]